MMYKLDQHQSCDKVQVHLIFAWKGRQFDINKSTKDLRIWKGRRFENNFKSDRDLRS